MLLPRWDSKGLAASGGYSRKRSPDCLGNAEERTKSNRRFVFYRVRNRRTENRHHLIELALALPHITHLFRDHNGTEGIQILVFSNPQGLIVLSLP